MQGYASERPAAESEHGIESHGSSEVEGQPSQASGSDDQASERTIKVPWSKEEDQCLMDLVAKHGTKSWKTIAEHLQGRTKKQCRDRWNLQLDPHINRDPWTPSEDAMIIQEYKKIGPCWAEIARSLKGRTNNAVKNRWNSNLKRRVEPDRASPRSSNPEAQPGNCLAYQGQSLYDSSFQRFHTGDVVLQSGKTLHNAWIGFATWGCLNRAGSNCVLYPTAFSGNHLDNAAMIGRGRALDPSRWYIVVPNLLGNGDSASPSNAVHLYKGGDFPAITMYDNVSCQKRLLDHLKVKRIKLALGWSVGATQAWHWAVLFPDMVENLLSVCGASRSWPYNQAVLKSLRGVLEADACYASGSYSSPPLRGLKAFGRAYMPWAFSAGFFREQRFRELGYTTAEELVEAWEKEFMSMDANDLVAKLSTWHSADVSAHPMFDGDLARALGSVRARCIVMPCDRDKLFTQEENNIEVSLTPRAELRPLSSSTGHCAGAPGRFKEETASIEAALLELLSQDIVHDTDSDTEMDMDVEVFPAVGYGGERAPGREPD